MSRHARASTADGPAARAAVPTMQGLLEVAESYLDHYDRPDLAAVVLEKVLDEDPANPAALTLAGRIAARENRDDVAEVFLRQALEIAPFSPDARRHIGALQIGRGDLAGALATLEEAARLAPQDAGVRFDMGSVLVHMGRPDKAADAFRAALARDPGCDRAIKALVIVDLEARRFGPAADGYRTLLRNDGQEVRGHLIAAGPTGTVRDWCLRTGAAYAAIAPAGTADVHPPRFAGEPVPSPVAVPRPETYVAEIADAVAIGGETLVLTAAGDALLDLFGHDRVERFDLTERALRFAAEGAALVDAERIGGDRIPAAVHLLGVSSFNYFHWMIEVLPRLANLEAAGAAIDQAGLPILVDAEALAVPQHLATLRAIVGPDRELIAVERETAVRVGRLIVPGQLSWLSNNLKNGLLIEPEDVLITAEAVRFLRDRLTPAGLRRPSAGHRRISLVRASSKRLQNAADLTPVLEKYGLEPVMPERLSFEEQVRLFAEVDLVVSESGAGLTNLAFAPPAARAVVLTGSTTWRPTWFSQISGVLGQSMTYVGGTVVAPNPKTYQSCFTIDPADLERALAEALGGRSGPDGASR